MSSDYRAIRAENERRYGTDIGRIGPMLLADRYDDRTHFVYELLQNAEDALAKRGEWNGKRSVRFELGRKALHITHYGKAFDEADVRGICGIAESTKSLTAIGRFGIGFKSVYAFTDRPEIYSGDESFAIENFVWPVAISAGIVREHDETVVALPLREPSERSEIEVALKRLGPASLLFLRATEEIEWTVEGGLSGLYLRSQQDLLRGFVRRVTVIGQTAGAADAEESWLLFSRPVTLDGREAGYVELAFSLEGAPHGERIRPVSRSPLVVFFPTVLETHLGFLVQGPYRTTPSRDNVPIQDSWNRHCVAETANVLRDALLWLRDSGYVNASALRCLPLARAKFPEDAMFAPIFESVRRSLLEEALLPRHGGGYIAAQQARLARGEELRALLSAAQLTALLGTSVELAWLSGDISQDRTPDLRDYLIEELEIEEVRPETLLSKLSAAFLEAQADEWVRRLYEFLSTQKALHLRARELALVRLRNGKHVLAQVNGASKAFLPGAVATGFPTVRATVCDTAASRDFLVALGLTEPDLVDDVIVNLLSWYSSEVLLPDAVTYATHIERMLRAYGTDSESRRARLVAALRDASFVACIDQGDRTPRMAKPSDVYLATERLTQLFADVAGVLIVDDGYACLKGEDVRTLLVACGGRRYLDPVPTEATLDWERREAIRREAGLERATWARMEDTMLRGLPELLRRMEGLDWPENRARATLLWDALVDLESRQGSGAFLGTYTWGYSHESKTARFDSAFIRLLNDAPWIAGPDGALHRPFEVLFDSLDWAPNPFLLSKIRFKPPVIEELAREAGIEPGVLDLLKRLGVTSEAELRERLGIQEEARVRDQDGTEGVVDALKKLGIAGEPTPPVPDPTAGDPTPLGGRGGASTGGGGGAGSGGTKRTPGSPGGRPFISYVGTHSDEEHSDPDGLDQTARGALEAKAIELIRLNEPQWQPTPTHNPGFDLLEPGPDGQPLRWCEVKAMTGSLEDRPVGLSRTQFECAREHGTAYWLFVVEHAGTDRARVVRIQDPAGKARTFTFDHGWRDVAEGDSESEEIEG